MSILWIDMLNDNILVKEQLRKKVARSGNGGAVWVPREWLGEEIIVTRLEREKSTLKEDIIRILLPYLEEISGIFLYGSCARGEESSESDVDILVISSKRLPVKNIGKFDIDVIELGKIKKVMRKNPLFYYSIIKEAKPIFNGALLEELKGEKLSKGNFRWYFKTTNENIKSNRELLELDRLDGEYVESYSVIYSVILRLRGIMLMKSLINNRVFSNKLFKKWITRYVTDYEFREIYNVYRAMRDNKKVKDVEIRINSIEKLLKLLERESRDLNGK